MFFAGGVVDLLEPRRSDSAANVEDGCGPDLTVQAFVLDDGCHAGIMGERSL